MTKLVSDKTPVASDTKADHLSSTPLSPLSQRKRTPEIEEDRDARPNSSVGTKRLFNPNSDNPIPGTRSGSQGIPSTQPNLPFRERHNQKPRQRTENPRRSRAVGFSREDGRRNDAARDDWQSALLATRKPTQYTPGGSMLQPTKRSDAARAQEIHNEISKLLLPSTRASGIPEAQRISLQRSVDKNSFSESELIANVKGLYAGLVMVEARCIEVDTQQEAAAKAVPANEQLELTDQEWRARVALHSSLLDEHYDFFLASQHPSASAACHRLAKKYMMPARLWRHGIHHFLENLRRGLPDSLEHMLSFVYMAYTMMVLLYETVISFEATWVECLGDLARYRMAIEDESLRDREIWSDKACSWYNKAADINPDVGRLYHHLAILARPDQLQQVYYYTRALTCVHPFPSARDSISTLFDPIIGGSDLADTQVLPVKSLFVKTHALLFTGTAHPDLERCCQDLLAGAQDQRIFLPMEWRSLGAHIAMTNVAALFQYGRLDGLLRRLFELERAKDKSVALAHSSKHPTTAVKPARILSAKDDLTDLFRPEASSHPGGPRRLESRGPQGTEAPMTGSQEVEQQCELPLSLGKAFEVAFGVFEIALKKVDVKEVMPHVHTFLVFIRAMTRIPQAHTFIREIMPWSTLATYLNGLDVTAHDPMPKCFPKPKPPARGRPLPEDFTLRGQIWSQRYFPDVWFTENHIDEEDRRLEQASMSIDRTHRIRWLGFEIASVSSTQSRES